MGNSIIKNENDFCESIDCEMNEFKLFIYDSRNTKSVINLPWILLEYKQWMIEKGFIKWVKT